MPAYKNSIRFILDGKITEIDFEKEGLSPTQTLLHYLRSLPGHKGTKEGCGEGDCGACTVVLGELINDKIVYKAVDSCLIFLPMVHGKQVITIENLATHKTGKTILHPVQQAVIDENGSQCGFCTPGFIMSIFALYKNETKPSAELIRNALAGNLCRCTGYHALLKATQKVFKEKKEDHFSKNEPKVKALLTGLATKDVITIESRGQRYLKPFTCQQLLELKKTFPDALIVSGSTDCGLKVTKKHEVLPLIIDISDVAQLSVIKKTKNIWHIGAGAKLEIIRNAVKKDLPVLYDMLTVFGSKQIRNMATLGGNVGSASPIGDTLPVLFAHNATVVLQNTKAEREIPIAGFITGYRQTIINKDEVITAIRIPVPDKNSFIKSYKISKRKDLDISTVSACFNLELNGDKVKQIILAFGGMAACTQRALKTENFLKGKVWNEKNVQTAMPLIEKDFSPISDARAGKEMRMMAAKNLLMKLLLDTNEKQIK
ncbi:MAG: 4-hydroxybenzoyl-CoA reductase subunit gamma [Bacteroidetes bacterium ADurb.Bin408]|nr:MAG: 4-hydroxybenzoyl-CoA reductase subunit gamma [Bacteroidetes bacterium ADurb.Bin408]